MNFPVSLNALKTTFISPVEAETGEAYTDCEMAFETISELSKELDRRENLLRREYCSIKDYNAKNEDILPYLLLLIDEYADLIFMSDQFVDLDEAEEENDETETGEETDTFITDLMYLCQNGHRFGIHVAISSKCLSPEIMTGAIKAFIPSRIAFIVKDVEDNYTILDREGAELLEVPGNFILSDHEECIFAHAPLCVDHKD